MLTTALQYTFLLKIIGQLTADGTKSVKLGEVDMPGRTTKALTHIWGKIRAEAAASGGPSGATPKKTPATPRKRSAPKTGRHIQFYIIPDC